MLGNRHEDLIQELRSQRRLAMESFDKITLIKNENLAEYFFIKFQEGQDVPFKLLKDVPIGSALLLPVVYGGAIVTTKEKTDSESRAVYNTRWTSGSTITWHYHSDCNETIEVIEGKVKIFIEGGIYELKKGDTIDIAANRGHQVTALYESQLKLTFNKIR